MSFTHIESQPQLELSNFHELYTPNVWDKRLKTDNHIYIHHFLQPNELHVRLLFYMFSKDKSKYLTRYFDSLYKIDFDLDLSTEPIDGEIKKIEPVVRDLILKFEPEYNSLSEDYDLPNLASLSSEALARKIIEDFDPSTDISHL